MVKDSSKEKGDKQQGKVRRGGKLDGGEEGKKRSKVLRNKKMKTEKSKMLPVAEIIETHNVSNGETSDGMDDKKKSKLKNKKRNKDRTKKADVHNSNDVALDSNQQNGKLDDANADKKRNKVSRNKRKKTKLSNIETTKIFVSNSPGDSGMNDKKKGKLKKKKRNKENIKEHGAHGYAPCSNEVGDDSNKQTGKLKSTSQTEIDASFLDDEDEAYQISSGDEDETTGMKRWINEYHRARPGVEILWERINDFLVDYWEQKEEERKEREAEAAEGGWTVVAHHKGRKKTTESESGITVGSVSQAAVMDKMAKKKNKEVGLNFYRFQRREAQRNEIMMLQSKFEQDKKRIQQMRSARKFRPY